MPRQSASDAGLRYVSDATPGIRRRKTRGGFRYVDAGGRRIDDPETLGRIRSLAVPPAWTDVWISPAPEGHLQATGRDARGRKQYRYHPEWRRARDENKYARLLAFGRALPAIRRRVDEDLSRPGLPREKVLPAIVRLLEMTCIRVGNEEYVRANNSFGLTTMRDRHAVISGARVRFVFQGKGQKRHSVTLHDRRLASVVRRCQDLPGQVLFQYPDPDGEPRPIGSADVNAYLHEIAGEEFTAKDFRTWAGTVAAARALHAAGGFESQAEAKRKVKQAMEGVAEELGNSAAICRKCYVHPLIVEAYLDGSLGEAMEGREAGGEEYLSAEECAVIRILEREAPREDS